MQKAWKNSPSIVMAISSVAMFVVSYKQMLGDEKQWKVLIEQGISARNELVLSHPPRLVANEFQIHESGKRASTEVRAMQELDGTVYVINAGDHDAVIERSCWQILWQTDLPMSRPQYPECDKAGGRLLIEGMGTEVSQTLSPGDFGRFVIKDTVPSDYKSGARFYVIGVINFRLKLEGPASSPLRHMMFARYFDPGEKRFIPVDNRPEYNGNE